VCLIREGSEVGAPAVPETIGCLATIERWEMRDLGMFELLARGGERFRLLDTKVAPNGLMTGSVERLPAEPTASNVDPDCRNVLQLIIDRVGAQHFPEPVSLDDAVWVGCRLAEVLPLDARVKQSLLEADAGSRLARVREILVEQGLVDR
jgi:Lon protease-like protein